MTQIMDFVWIIKLYDKNLNLKLLNITILFVPCSNKVHLHLLCLLFVSSEEWSKVGDTERGNLGITVEDDGEFW